MARKARLPPQASIHLAELELSFFGVAPAGSSWGEFVESLGLETQRFGESGWRARGGALPDVLNPGDFYILVEAHPAPGADERSAHWVLTWKRIPSSPPPKSLVSVSKSVGGMNFPERLTSAWIAERSTRIQRKARFLVLSGGRSVFRTTLPKLRAFRRKGWVAKQDSLMEVWKVTTDAGLEIEISETYLSREGQPVEATTIEWEADGELVGSLFEGMEREAWEIFRRFRQRS